MEILDHIRYGVALLHLILAPSSLFLWLVIHPFIGFWRRRGPRTTYAVLAVLKLSIMAAAFLLRHELLAVDFGSHLLPALLALPVFALAISVQRRRREKLAPKALNGLPELTATSQDPGHLIEDGIYAHLRHPRYLELSLILLGWALLSNYLAIYVIAAGAPFILTWTALLEERELRQRFGATYDAYCRRVPRCLPKVVTHRFSSGRC